MKWLHHELNRIFFYRGVKTDLSCPRMFTSVWCFWHGVMYSAANNRVICEESVNDIFTITELGRSVFICACISVYHVKHLHLIEFQMLSGIVMKPGPHCYGNLGWKGGLHGVSPKSSPWHFNVCLHALYDFCLFFFLKKRQFCVSKMQKFISITLLSPILFYFFIYI